MTKSSFLIGDRVVFESVNGHTRGVITKMFPSGSPSPYVRIQCDPPGLVEGRVEDLKLQHDINGVELMLELV